MKVRKVYELLNRYSASLNDEILFYDSNGDELKLADIDADDGDIIVELNKTLVQPEVEEWKSFMSKKVDITKLAQKL